MFLKPLNLVLALVLSAFTTSMYSQETGSKQTFHLGISGISTFTTSSIDQQYLSPVDTVSYNPLDIGFYCGNEFDLKGNFILDLEFFYLNNKVEISRLNNRRFELPQNIGCLIKPGIVINNHRVFLSTGITAVYVFDKDEEFGNQYDRFDQAIFLGGAYDYRINNSISVQLSFVHAKFNSISHYTPNELKQFSIVSLGLNYHLE